MVRRVAAKDLKLDEGTVCVNVFGLSVENRSPALDDDSRVLVLNKPDGHCRPFQEADFRHAVDCSLVSFSPQQTVMELSSAVFVVAAEKRLSIPMASRALRA